MADPTTEDFLYSSPVDYAPYADSEVAPPVAQKRIPPMVLTAGWLALGLVVGVLAMTLLHANGSTNANGVPTAVTGNLPPGTGGQGFNGPPGFGSGSGVGGEQRLFGTLTAVGSSSFTLRTSSGSTTYRVDATTELVKDGQRVSSLSAMQVGDSVLVHVYPVNGTAHVERVIDGPPPGRGGDGGGTAQNTGTTTT